MIVLALAAAAVLLELDAAIKTSVASCPVPVHGEIVVCASRRDDEARRYLPPIRSEYERGDPRAQSVSAERNGLFDYDAGGNGACSTVGPGGWTGCGFQRHKRWALQKAGARDGRGPIYDK